MIQGQLTRNPLSPTIPARHVRTCDTLAAGTGSAAFWAGISDNPNRKSENLGRDQMTDVSPPPPPPSASPPPAGAGLLTPSGPSPIQMDLVAPLEVANWRVIGNPILAIPHLIYLGVLSLVVGVITVIAWFSILFTGKYPESMYDFAAGVMRYQWRVVSYYYFMREPYPAFGTQGTLADPGGDPATFSITYPGELSRGLIWIKWLLAIPAFVVLFVYILGVYVALIVAFFTVLFTGKWPENWRAYTIRVMRYSFKVNAYYNLMTDVYPGFTVE
jgi:hypothetical protein